MGNLKVIPQLFLTLYFSRRLVLVPVTSQLVQASWRIILERHVSADDSIHLLSTLVTLSEIFVAADDYLIERARE
ncbi:hypothetical protein DRP04_09110, partial [Archaeoglobales archaeon]